MKRNIGFFLFSLYLLSLSGLMVQLHFCENELVNWRISQTTIEDSHLCCIEKVITENNSNALDSCSDSDCCEDQYVNVDAAQEYFSQSNFSLDFLALQSATLYTLSHTQTPNFYALKALANVKNNSPPSSFATSVPSYIKFQKLILYA